MKKAIRTAIIAGLLLVSCFSFNSCMTVHIDAKGIHKDVLMTTPERKFSIVKHINESKTGVFMIFNLITVSEPDIKGFLDEELQGTHGDAIINVKITGQTTFVDGLVPEVLGLVGSIAAPPYGSLLSGLIGLRTYTVEADIIKYNAI